MERHVARRFLLFDRLSHQPNITVTSRTMSSDLKLIDLVYVEEYLISSPKQLRMLKIIYLNNQNEDR